MRARTVLGAAAALAIAVATAEAGCSSALRYPACERDEQCTRGTTHDYCLAGRCVYCRSSVDCGDRQMCRAGACAPDPNAPPPPSLDAGDDGDDGSAEDEADAGTGQDEDDAPPESPRHVLPRGVRRFFRP